MIALYPFGPYIGKWKLAEDVFQPLLQLTDDILASENKVDVGEKLAGQIKGQFEIPIGALEESDILKAFLDCSLQYINGRKIQGDHGDLKKIDVNMMQCWVNSMYKHEWNPPHVHNIDLSSIVILKLPDKLKQSDQTRYFLRPQEGQITFINGSFRAAQEFEQGTFLVRPEEGDFYLFPARLHHSVMPFTCEGERRTVSFNIKVNLHFHRDQEKFDQSWKNSPVASVSY